MTDLNISIDDFLDTYDSPTNYGEKFASELVQDEILPLSINNPVLKDLNILASWVFWSGCIYNHYAEISHDDPSILNPISESLQITPNTKRNRVIFTPNTKYARVLETMGIINTDGSKGRKPDYVSHIPQYLTSITDTFDEYDASKQIELRKLLQDSVKIILNTRFRNQSRQPYVQLNTMRNKDQCIDFSLETLKLFQIAFPNLGLKSKHIEIEDRSSKGTYNGKIRFNKEPLKIARKEYDLLTTT